MATAPLRRPVTGCGCCWSCIWCRARWASVAGVLLLYPFGPDHRLPLDKVTQRVEAVVAAATPADCTPGQRKPDPGGQRCLALSLMLSNGPAAGRGIVSIEAIEQSTPPFTVGDRVVLSYNGGHPTSTDSYIVDDFQRGKSLWLLGLLFAGAVIALGRWRGLAALAARLGVSFAVLVLFVIPAVLA